MEVGAESLLGLGFCEALRNCKEDLRYVGCIHFLNIVAVEIENVMDSVLIRERGDRTGEQLSISAEVFAGG